MRLGFIAFGISVLGLCQHAIAQTATNNDWTPPLSTIIPPAYVAATKNLLGNGLADPRGGEFHKVTVVLGYSDQWSQEQKLQEKQGYGWILPDKQVVLIDGLKYPLKQDLGRANLADLIPKRQVWREGIPWGALGIEYATIALPALLLVHGETALAEDCWRLVGPSLVDPILSLYSQLTYRYHMQVAQYVIEQDDLEALRWAKQLMTISDQREKDRINYGEDTVGWRFDPEEPRQILLDLTRRIEHPKQKFDTQANAKLDKKDRLASLIEALDQVVLDARGAHDPIATEIVKVGDAAVPALLDVIENDQRMTRSVILTYPKRTIHPVRTAAYSCLEAIWPSSVTILDENPQTRLTKLRKLWKSSENLTEPERWLNVLRDDGGNFRTWPLAAQQLTDRFQSKPAFPTKSRVMLGEALRSKHGKEVTTLLIKRMEILTTFNKDENSTPSFEFTEGLSIGHYLYLWDREAAEPALRQAVERTMLMVSQPRREFLISYSNFARPFAQVIADRANLGDKTAAKDYAQMLKYYSENFNEKDILIALWKRPNDAALQAAAGPYFAMLLAEKRLPDKPGRLIGIHPVDDLLRSPMLLSPAFRSFLADAIALPKLIGTVSVAVDSDRGSIQYRFGKNGVGSEQAPKGMDVSPYTAKDIPLTSGDYISHLVAKAKGAPQFLLSWPESKKATAKKEIVKWLNSRRVDWVEVVKSNPFVNLDYD